MNNITWRGTVRFPTALLPRFEDLLAESQWAQPKTIRGVAAKDPFGVWKDLGGGHYLLPRYSPLIVPLAAHRKHFIHQEPTTIGQGLVRWNPAFPLQERQLPGTAAAEQVLLKKRGCLVKGDTGSGKTVVGLQLLYRLQPARTLVLVDQIDIALQWAERIRQFLPHARIEYLMPDTQARWIRKRVAEPVDPDGALITIGTAQSLRASTRYTFADPFCCELLICDEVHVFGAPTFMAAVFKVNFGRSIGLTATDDRKDELDWVFRQCLGWTVVPIAGETLEPVVHQMIAPSCGLRSEQWNRAYCRQFHEMTWEAKCRACMFWDMFPGTCGGEIPLNSKQNPKWGILNRTALVAAWTAQPEYVAWLQKLIRLLVVQKKRRIFCFAENRRFLVHLYELSVAEFGAQNVGLFLGKGKGAEDEPDYSAQRDTALTKVLTFATYGVARKALDVRAKDTAILATPVSDARQVAGRVRRTDVDKSTPLVIVPVPLKIAAFVRSWKTIRAQFQELGWKIIEDRDSASSGATASTPPS